MIIVRCLFLMLFATCFYGSNALAAGNSVPLASHNFLTPELKPSPDSFKLAKSTFLPETYDDLGLSGAHNKYGDFIEVRHCFPAYPLKTCPIGAKCDKCPVGPAYRCQSPSILSNGNCVCPAAAIPKCTNDKCVQRCSSSSSSGWLSHTVCVKLSCEPSPDETDCTIGTLLCDNGCCQNTRKCCIPCFHTVTTKPANSSYTYSSCTDGNGTKNIQTGWACNSGYHKSGDACVKDCNVTNCAGYTLSSCPANATCSSCTKTAANCSTDGTMFRLDSCASGYSKSGDACVEKDDTCPNGYYKSCETGTQGTPEYTEKGTACYQCKPKTTENMKVVVNFARSCPSGLSFKMTPQGGSAVTCSSSQCYEYDVSNYPYAPDGRHSNETETVVAAGTQINLSSIPSAVSDIKSISKNQTYSVSGTTYSFNVNDRATVVAGVGQNTNSGLGAYDFWTLQCKQTSTQIGDILYSDMTTSSEVISEKTPIGVVFDPERKLAIALNEEEVYWSENSRDIPNLPNLTTKSSAMADFNGKSNTKIIVNYCQTIGATCQAAEYANSYTTKGSTAGDWYLPALGELNTIYENRGVLNTALTKVNSTELKGSNYNGNVHLYFSSSEYDSTHAWGQYFGDGDGYYLYDGYVNYENKNISNSNNYGVRPVIKF